MWICSNKGFVSIVDKAPDKKNLSVRARRAGDINRVFPGSKEIKTPGRDYLFRAYIPREVVANAIRDSIMGLSYPNFKDSVRDDDLHHAYANVWSVMGRLQPGGPYSDGEPRYSKNNRNRDIEELL